MGKEERVDLTGPLAGHYIVVDIDAITLGVLEDLESSRVGSVRAAIEAMIKESDIGPMRDLHLPEFQVLIEAIGGVIRPKKAG